MTAIVASTASLGPVAQGCLIDWFGAAPSSLVRGLPDEYVRVLDGLGSDAWLAFRTERPKAALPSLALHRDGRGPHTA